MVLQAMKESKLPAVISRLSPPNSPSRSRTSASMSRPHTKSRILAKLDELDILSEKRNIPLESVRHQITRPPKPQHPFSNSMATNLRAIGNPLNEIKLLTAEPSQASSSSEDPFASSSSLLQVKRLASTGTASSLQSKPNTAPPLGATRKAFGKTASLPTIPRPLYSYKDFSPVPAVVYIRNEEEADELVQALKGPLGFDLEWRVFLRRGVPPSERRVALVQLCDTRMILLVQVSAMKRFPQKVKEVIESSRIVKIGANILNDGRKLFRDYGIYPENLVELGALAREADSRFKSMYTRSIVSLNNMTETYTGKSLDKDSVRISDWEAMPLTELQRTYAANDAHVALTVYNRLLAIAAQNKQVLDSAKYTSRVPREPPTQTSASASAPEVSTSTPAIPQPIASSASLPNMSSAPAKPPSTRARPLSYTTTVYDRPTPRPQELRAYTLWHHDEMPLNEICAALRSKENPLAESTVISYVVRALQTDPALSFSMEKLKTLVQLEAGSWTRHRDWILRRERQDKRRD